MLDMLAPADLASMRLVCHDFGSRAAPHLFADTAITLRPTTFTKPARMEALGRIGGHVKSLTFNLPQGRDTVLPPVIDPATGAELPFLYEPQVEMPADPVAKIKRPKYGTWEMTDLLIKQYPPLFHAATNIPSFVAAFSALPALEHLRVSCPGADTSASRSHRSIVDYALISLRIAVERAPLLHFRELSLLPVHAGGLLYLHPMLGFGSTAASARRWGQLRRLTIHLDSFSFGSRIGVEHLRILHAYLHALSRCLTRLAFRWTGERGPSPLSLDGESSLQPAGAHPCRTRASLDAAAATGLSEAMKPLKFRRLQALELENAAMGAGQVSAFIRRHRRTLSEFHFEDVHLRDGACWDDALAPLTSIAGNDNWKRCQEEVMDVPLMLSPDARILGPAPRRAAPVPPPADEPRVMGPLGGDTAGVDCVSPLPPLPAAGGDTALDRGTLVLGRWLSKGKAAQAAAAAARRPSKAQYAEQSRHHLFGGGGEHVRRFLRGSVFPWR